MKTSYYLVAIISFLIISCSSNDSSEGELNLVEISKKLNALNPSVINKNADDFEMLLKTNLQKNKFLKTNDKECQHTVIETDSFKDANFTLTTTYFDKDMNPITNCATYSQASIFEYNTRESQITLGTNFKYTINALGNHSRETNSSKSSYTDNLLIIGELDFDGDIFNIIEGSYFHTNYTFSFNFNNEDREDFDEIIDINYKFEFESNSQIYHFDMTIDGEELMNEITLEKSEIVLEYPLYNSKNIQIGIIKYVQNYETEVEKFILYDLDGNLVE
jgi:hypothetical protein